MSDWWIEGRKPAEPKRGFVQYCKGVVKDITNPATFGTKMLIRYVFDNDDNHCGAFVGWMDNGVLRTGWSKCNLREDRWNRHVAIVTAYKRALRGEEAIHSHFIVPYKEFLAECKMRFTPKTEEV